MTTAKPRKNPTPANSAQRRAVARAVLHTELDAIREDPKLDAFEKRRAALLAELDAVRAAVLVQTPRTITNDELAHITRQLQELHAVGSDAMAEEGMG